MSKPPGRPSKSSDSPENYREAFNVRLSPSSGLEHAPLNNLKARETYSKHVEYVLFTDSEVELSVVTRSV